MLKTLIQHKSSLIFTRFYSTAWKEISIPVPWGHVAGKWWGPQDQQPILATHGWLDNSGTFDTLIPLLPKTVSFLAIDFPGCGHSSKLPPGVFYHLIDIVILLRRIVTHFKWKKVSLLGHSMGAVTNYTYTMVFPEEVEFLICLDNLSPITESVKVIDRMQKNINDFLRYDELNSAKEEPPSYSSKEIVDKLHNGLQFVALDKAKHILERNTKPASNDPSRMYFTIDPRWKTFDLLRWSEDELVANAHRLTCPILLIRTDKGPFFVRKGYAVKVIDVIKESNKNFEMHDFVGTHHLHLNNPEEIESVINQFLKKFNVS